jgi:hypothetical protein
LFIGGLSFAQADNKTTDSVSEFTELKTGDISQDDHTSAAIFEILRRCALQYKDAKHFSARGTYIESTKHFTSDEAQFAAKLEIQFSRPNRLRIDLKDSEISSMFLADGTTITMAWPNDRRFQQIAQPDSLSAFSEQERNGPLLTDESNSIMRSVVAALLITPDPIGWLHANVIEYDYEGTEAVEGSLAYRVRFRQTNPHMIVLNWIDTKSYFLRKVSIIRGLDEDGNYVDSYEKAKAGTIRVAKFSSIETTGTVAKDSFKWSPPKGWKVKKEELATVPQPEESPWMRLFRVAAAETGTVSATTMTVQFGSNQVVPGWHYSPRQKVLGLVPFSTATTHSICAGLDNSSIALLDFNGTAYTVPVAVSPEYIAPVDLATTTGAFVAESNGKSALCRLDGTSNWQYDFGQRILDVQSNASGSTVTIRVGTLSGLVSCSKEGAITFSSRTAGDIISIAQIPGSAPVAATVSGEIVFYHPWGEYLREFNVTDSIASIALTSRSHEMHILTFGTDDNNDPVLRSYGSEGALEWTSAITAQSREADTQSLSIVRRNGNPDVAATLSSDGSISLVTLDGKPFWRGIIKAVNPAISPEPSEFAFALTTADLNGDGTDEIYVSSKAGVTQLKYVPPAPGSGM